MTRLRLAGCTHEAARFAVLRWHYSRSMPSGKLVKIGVWENDAFIGCVLFGRGSSPFLGQAYRLEQTEIAELVRIALGPHVTPVSRIGAIALREYRRLCPGTRLIVSFADPEQGHHGGIYQAMGWIYAGCSNPTELHRVGRRWRHTRSVAGTTVQPALRELFVAGRIPSRTAPGKHRYLWPFDPEVRALVAPLAQPYPKRNVCGESKDGVARAFPVREGGSIPTSPLQEAEKV